MHSDSVTNAVSDSRAGSSPRVYARHFHLTEPSRASREEVKFQRSSIRMLSVSSIGLLGCVTHPQRPIRQ